MGVLTGSVSRGCVVVGPEGWGLGEAVELGGLSGLEVPVGGCNDVVNLVVPLGTVMLGRTLVVLMGVTGVLLRVSFLVGTGVTPGGWLGGLLEVVELVKVDLGLEVPVGGCNDVVSLGVEAAPLGTVMLGRVAVVV